jgi:hypothetical protein
MNLDLEEERKLVERLKKRDEAANAFGVIAISQGWHKMSHVVHIVSDGGAGSRPADTTKLPPARLVLWYQRAGQAEHKPQWLHDRQGASEDGKLCSVGCDTQRQRHKW